MNRMVKKSFFMRGEKGSSLDLARGRLVIISAVFIIAYIIVAARVVDLTVIQGGAGNKRLSQIAEEPYGGEKDVMRADIVDRNGILLARSLKTISLYADPVHIQNPEQVAKDLVKIFPDLSYGETLKKLQGKNRFAWIKRHLAPADQEKLLYLGHPGLAFKDEYERVYPQSSLTSHVVGYASIEGEGLSGIENSFNKLLNDSKGPLMLTLDVRLQHALRQELLESLKKFRAVAGAGLIMDVRNGEVLAAVSLPDFNPIDYPNAKDNQKFNRFSLGAYELGSVFKIFSTAAFIETQNNPFGQVFDAREPLKRGRRTINDYHAQKRIMTLPEVFIHSSNIGTALMGEQVGTKGLQDFYEDLGLMKPVSFELPEVGKPILPNPWQEISTTTVSYGHGISVSPLQLVTSMASIINGGELIQPTIILDNSGHNNSLKKERLRVVSPQTAHRMRQLMRLVVTDGTASKADVAGMNVGGKTGTAEKPTKQGYIEDKIISSFVGAFPMDDPRYAIFVMLDEPKGTKDTFGYATAGWVAAPTVAKIVSRMVMVLGLSTEAKDDIGESLRTYIKSEEQVKEEKNAQSH